MTLQFLFLHEYKFWKKHLDFWVGPLVKLAGRIQMSKIYPLFNLSPSKQIQNSLQQAVVRK